MLDCAERLHSFTILTCPWELIFALYLVDVNMLPFWFGNLVHWCKQPQKGQGNYEVVHGTFAFNESKTAFLHGPYIPVVFLIPFLPFFTSAGKGKIWLSSFYLLFIDICTIVVLRITTKQYWKFYNLVKVRQIPWNIYCKLSLTFLN